MLMGAIYVGRPRLAMSLALAAFAASGPRLLMRKRESRREKKHLGPGFARRSSLIIVPPTYDRG
jgi:hypothetical protein